MKQRHPGIFGEVKKQVAANERHSLTGNRWGDLTLKEREKNGAHSGFSC
jgi:hypothetical protein